MYSVHEMNGDDSRQDRLTLEVLSAIDSEREISQRRLASQMGVALGLTNSYIKRCVRKGYIKINEAPANRYLYYLTPKGFREKARLTARFLSSSLDFYRAAADSCGRVFGRCAEDGVDSVVLCGNSELAEIAFLKAMEANVSVAGLLDESGERTRFFSRTVWRRLDDLPALPRILTRIEGADELRSRLAGESPELKVYIPDVLGLKPEN